MKTHITHSLTYTCLYKCAIFFRNIYADLKKESIVRWCCHFTFKSHSTILYIAHYRRTYGKQLDVEKKTPPYGAILNSPPTIYQLE